MLKGEIMFQMNCPSCKEIIKSHFLAELKSIECEQCKETVPVKDVFVTTKGFTMHREDLLNRIFRFQSLLREVEKEMQLIAQNKDSSKVTQKSLAQFYSTLQELLAGARRNFRLEIPYDLFVEMDYKQNIVSGKLINLSSEGASVAFEASDELPKKSAEINFSITLPALEEPIQIATKVIWVKMPRKDEESQPVIVGVKFVDLDENIRDLIWNFIVVTEQSRAQANKT